MQFEESEKFKIVHLNEVKFNAEPYAIRKRYLK